MSSVKDATCTTAEQLLFNLRRERLDQLRHEARRLAEGSIPSIPPDSEPLSISPVQSGHTASGPSDVPTFRDDTIGAHSLSTTALELPAASNGTSLTLCPGCFQLRLEVSQLKEMVAALTSTVQHLSSQIASREAVTALDQRSHDVTPTSRPPPADEYEAELVRSSDLRSRAAGVSFQPTSPILRDQLASLEIKNDLRTLEQKTILSLTKLANRLAQVEGDAATAIDDTRRLQEELNARLVELQNEKVSKMDLKPLVLPIVDTARDIVGERVSNIYRLLGWPEARVQHAVATGDIDEATDVVFCSPSLGRLVDGLVKNAADIDSLRDEVHYLHHMRMMHGPTLGSKQRLLGLDLSDEPGLKGVRVAQVFAGSPGYLAGFRVGDVITMVNHVHVTSRTDFLRVMSGVLPNTVVRIVRCRGKSNHVQRTEEVEVIATGESSDGAASI